MRISVLIATFNRAALLDDCLEHVGRQKFERGDEVIVVDNGSTDATGDVIRRHARRFPVPLRTMVELKPGKSGAIARGLSTASGDVFAFTDDDVAVGESWLDALRAAMTDEVALVGGRVLPRWERRPPRWLTGPALTGRLAAPLAIADYGSTPGVLGPRTAMGGNMAVRREVVVRLGGFDENLGSVRGTLMTGEDHEFSLRVQAAGFRAIYQPSAVVFHRIPASRMRVAFFLRWFFWSGIANATIDALSQSRPRRIFGVPRYLFRRFAFAVAAAPALALSGRLSDAVDRAADAAFAAGYAARCWRPMTPGRRRSQPGRQSLHSRGRATPA
jgi:GT2 family glycosyltransferase